jgi:hypothetical protein
VTVEDLRAATDKEVVLAWLQAELFDSSRFAANYFGPWETPLERAFVRRLIDSPDLADDAENYIRKTKLAIVRGFGWSGILFQGLTDDITWRRVRFTTDEIGQMLYANNVPSWRYLAPSLRVAEGAHRVANIQPQNAYTYIVAIAQKIHDSDLAPAFPEIICLQRPDGEVSVMEGHGRATAFVKEAAKFPDGIDVYLGSGPSVAHWRYL